MSVQQTLGLLPRLCTCMGTRLWHQAMPEYRRPRSSKDQHTDQRDQDQAREAGYRQRRASFARQASPTRGEATPKRRRPKRLDRACRDSQRPDHPTDYSTMTHVVDQCGVKTQDD